MTGRSSFAGNTKGLYAGKKPATLEPIVTTTTDEKSMKKKNERRERTFTQIGVSASVRSAMASQMGELLSKIDANQSAEEKLKQVMIGAKQSGMTVEKIFSFFSNDSNSTKDLTPDAFRSALKALSPTVFDLEESEVKEIVVKFDTDGDGLISFAEFKNYCYYNINAVCWRAERLRMEKSGEMKRLAAETAHQIVPEHDDEKPEFEEVVVPLGEKIYEGNKLYWRSNATIYIRMWHNKEVEVITISAWNETEDVHFPPLFCDSSRIHLDPNTVDEKMNKTISEQKNKKVQLPHEEIRATVINDILSAHILARLKVPDSSNPFPKNEMANKLPPISPRTESKMPFLTCLAADTEGTSIMVPRPANMEEPPKWQKAKHVSKEQFANLLADVTKANKEMKTMTTSAERMTALIDISMAAFKNAESDLKRKKNLSSNAQKWVNAFTVYITRKQVEEVRKVLANSPAYAQLLVETEEKKAASQRGIALPSV